MEKLKVLSLLCLMILAIVTSAQETATTRQAAQAYTDGNYIRAITLYDQALLAQQNGALYYNLGASHYAAGNLGEAIWGLRMAALYLPRDAEVHAAIAQIRDEVATSTQGETNTLYLLNDSLSRLFTRYELGIMALVLWTGGFLLLILGMIRKEWQRITQSTAGAFAVLLVVVVFALGIMTFVQTQRPGGVIISESVQVMNGPGSDFLPLFTLNDAAEFRVLQRNGEWVRFALSDGRQGWLQDTNIKLIPNDLG